ncbi:hypothetical protein FA95DRAFT_1194206 [Auriscalpium vulgare]|uniref:Uncharacterized protein n=1 Tax=Auriscalpium vulgare TaxID=40419 RepID=A0ACB8R419_9AGAM|nr:hypothetical protein FA95DRAFT_1194206 [Auriscalpium vulgare]
MLQVQEEENITLLTSMMGDVDPDVVRRVLRKHNGDVQKAASSLLEGDTAEPSTSDAQDWSWGLLTGPMENTSGPRTPPRASIPTSQ